MFITSPSNLTYFSGFIPLDISEREAYICITPKHAYIFTSALYSAEVKTYVTDYELIEISAQNTFSKQFTQIIHTEKLNHVGFEENNVTYAEFMKLKKDQIPFYPTDISHLRIRKDTEEISHITNACAIGDSAFSSLLEKIHVGITEEEVAFELELFMRKQKAIPSFPTIVAFGANAAIPHHVTGKTMLQKNEFILLDFGVRYQRYCSDMSRTIFFGKPTKKQIEMYHAVLNSQQQAITYLEDQWQQKKEIIASEVDKISRSYLLKHGYPSFPHSLGHGIGIQVHESPSISPYSSQRLQQGMVFSIEPGIYDVGSVGIRIEDLVTLEKNSVSLLTKAPRHLITLS